MAWYSQQDINTQTEDSSLIVALANLLRKLGHADDLLTLTQRLEGQPLDWWTAKTICPEINVREVYDNDSWPTSDDAIIRFQRLDVASAGMVDHYCAVADSRVRSIVDSLDGVIKQADIYGSPQGWASYAKREATDELDDLFLDHPSEASKPNQLYKVMQAETIWDVGRKLNMSVKELLEHNDIRDAREVTAGYVLHLPTPRVVEEAPQIKYVLLDEAKTMHVTRAGGATKYRFGNARKWTDITSAGPTYPEGYNVKIGMVAYVPIGDGEMAKYLMDANAIGHYAETGRVTFTLGFNHSHLADGQAEQKKPEIRPEIAEKIEAVKEIVTPPPAPQPIIKHMDVAPQINPNKFKASYTPLNLKREPELWLFNDTIMVHDHDNKRPSQTCYRNRGVMLQGKFLKDGTWYGRPVESAKAGSWFGIPMHRIRPAYEPEDEVVFNNIGLAERIPRGRLSNDERYLTVPLSRVLSQYVRLTKLFSPKTKVTKE